MTIGEITSPRGPARPLLVAPDCPTIVRMSKPHGPDLGHGPAGRFASTHWSLIVAARGHDSPRSREALAALCATYWYPLYAYARRWGHTIEQAQDLTQDFFACLLEKDFLTRVDRERGRFRAFLLTSFKYFLTNEHQRARAQKRGGGRPLVSIDTQDAEERYRLEPTHSLTPERLFERRWALTLLDQVLESLAREYQRSGKAALYDRLKPVLTGDPASTHYAAIAQELGMTEAAVKKASQRLRARYRELLCEQIALTLENPADVEEEIRELFLALAV
jgi:RNA polymerase sigma factor (sigma-70 family)